MANESVGGNFGQPGKAAGGDGAGEVEASLDERVQRRVQMDRVCLYCERLYTAAKQNQRFCTSRCGHLANAGQFSDATFKRWEAGLDEIQRWLDGDDSVASPYKRPADVLMFDYARRRLFLTIAEMRNRIGKAAPAYGVRASMILVEGLLKLFALPAGVDLSGPYQVGDELARDLSDYQTAELGARGLDAWAIVADAVTRRLVQLTKKPPRDLLWLDL